MKSKLITICAVAHNEPSWNVPLFDSLLAQTDPDSWCCRVIHNGPAADESEFNNRCYWLKNDSRFQLECSPTDTGNWGTANRQRAIDECQTEYLVQTSVQDYWLPQAMGYITKTLTENKPDILVWNSVNHLVGPCRVLDADLKWSKLDWGNFAVKTEIAKQVPIKQKEYCADFLFVQDCMNKGLIKRAQKIDALLTIHN